MLRSLVGLQMNWFKSNWKILAWGVSIGVGVITWVFSIQTTIAEVREMKPKVEQLDKFKDVQSEVNRTVEKKLDKIIDILSGRGR